MIADLHCHSNKSDGELGLAELVSAARDAGVTVLAVTDHDAVHPASELAGLASSSMTLIAGIEISSCWQKRQGVHIVGLDVDPDALTEAVVSQQRVREERANRIAELLENQGLTTPLEGASRYTTGDYIGRPHFARYMVACGFVKNERKAFQKYLGSAKITAMGSMWPDIEQAIAWISGAGGVAVLAHPLKYKLTRYKLQALCTDFRNAGGRAIEVVSGSQDESSTTTLSKLCQEGDFLASCGSDFHKPGQCWAALGKFPALPSSCRPVWDYWQ